METNVKRTQRVAANTGYMFLRMILVMGVGLFTSRVTLATLGFTDYGIYNVVGSLVIFLSFLKQALTNATGRYLSAALAQDDPKQLSEIYSMAIHCHLLLALLVGIVMEVAGMWYLDHHMQLPPDRVEATRWLYHCMLAHFCFVIVMMPYQSNIIAHEEFGFFARVSLVEVMLKLGVAYSLYVSPFDKLKTFGTLLASLFAVMLFCHILYCRRYLTDTRYTPCWNLEWMGRFLRFSGWSMLVNVTELSVTQSMTIGFNRFLGLWSNAALGIANQVVGNVNQFLNNFIQAIQPQIIKSYVSGEHDYFMKLLMTASKFSGYLFFAVAYPVCLERETVLRFWLGDYPPLTGSYLIGILTYMLVDAMQAPFVQAVFATGKLRTHQLAMTLIKGAVIPIMWFQLSARQEGLAVITVWVLFNLLSALVRMCCMRKLISLSMRRYLSEVVRPTLYVILLTLPVPAWISYAMTPGLVRMALTGLSACLVLTGTVWLMGLTDPERHLLVRLYEEKVAPKLSGIIRKFK